MRATDAAAGAGDDDGLPSRRPMSFLPVRFVRILASAGQRRRLKFLHAAASRNRNFNRKADWWKFKQDFNAKSLNVQVT